MRYFKTTGLLIALAVMTGLCAGCAYRQRVLLGLDDYSANPEAYKNFEVVITASLEDICSRYEQYRGKRVQVTAPCAYFGHAQFWTWQVLLSDNGRTLRCYTHHYRIKAEWDAENLLMRARADRQPVTVNGVLYRDGIDIREIIYREQTVRPHVKPLRVYPFFDYYY